MEQIEMTNLLDEQEVFIRSWLKSHKDIAPQVVVCKDKKMNVFVLVEQGREAIKLLLETLERTKPDWLVYFTEAYMEKVADKSSFDDYLKTYRHGTLEERFKAGDKTVKEIIIIQAYSSDGKMMRSIDKITMKPIAEDIDDFDGFLTISDVERVFWKT